MQIDLVDDVEDTMSLSTIAKTAMAITYLCVSRPGMPGFGGRERTGPLDEMLVLVAGRIKRGEVGNSESDLLRLPGQIENTSSPHQGG